MTEKPELRLDMKASEFTEKIKAYWGSYAASEKNPIKELARVIANDPEWQLPKFLKFEIGSLSGCGPIDGSFLRILCDIGGDVISNIGFIQLGKDAGKPIEAEFIKEFESSKVTMEEAVLLDDITTHVRLKNLFASDLDTGRNGPDDADAKKALMSDINERISRSKVRLQGIIKAG